MSWCARESMVKNVIDTNRIYEKLPKDRLA